MRITNLRLVLIMALAISLSSLSSAETITRVLGVNWWGAQRFGA